MVGPRAPNNSWLPPENLHLSEIVTADQILNKESMPIWPTLRSTTSYTNRCIPPLRTLPYPSSSDYNLFWHDLPITDHVKLVTTIKEQGKILPTNTQHFSFPNTQEIKNILIELGALHTQREGITSHHQYAYPLIRCCGLDSKKIPSSQQNRYRPPSEEKQHSSFVSALAGVKIRPRAPFRIGTRMGRPEKASPRKMRPPPHVLFPLGDYGGNQRLVKNAAENVTIEVEAGKRRCPKCNAVTFHLICACGTHTEVLEGKLEKQHINLSEELERAQKNVKEHLLPETIKGVIGTISKHKTPEPLEKGILRAKHNVYVFKDGTIRFDMTDAPLTHFKPKEIGVPLKRLKRTRVHKDYLGNELLRRRADLRAESPGRHHCRCMR